MLLTPWYDVVTPRKEICERAPAELFDFRVHLERVRDEVALEEYGDPSGFFARTCLTKSFNQIASDVMRRLSGERIGTNAVLCLESPRGCGKTHVLTLLYHLGLHGMNAQKWPGVPEILAHAGLSSLPKAAVAAVICSEFAAVKGLGGKRGEPLRKTPWGEIAFQLGGEEAFVRIEREDRSMQAPVRELISDILPADVPCLILIDDLPGYLRSDKAKGEQFSQFLYELADCVRNMEQCALLVTLPVPGPNLSTEEGEELLRLREMLESSGRVICIDSEEHSAEILRRRLFEWDAGAFYQSEQLSLPDAAHETCASYAEWIRAYRGQLPAWFPADNAEGTFLESYPFHPGFLAVFERKWSAQPDFQHLRGLLRLMALLIAGGYAEGYQRMYSDPLIGIGSAPLDDPEFRSSILEQLGDVEGLEAAVLSDISGVESLTNRLDVEAADEIKHNRLHRKAAIAIFFESKGGVKERVDASEAEIRLGIGEPDFQPGDIETVLEALTAQCYYISREDTQYRFSLNPNLNKLFADWSPAIDDERISELVKEEISRLFADSALVCLFPEKSADIPDRPLLTLVVPAPDYIKRDSHSVRLIETFTRDYGSADRHFKNALIWVLPDDDEAMSGEARKLLTWQDIQNQVQRSADDASTMAGVEPTKLLVQLTEGIDSARKTLEQAVWHSYRYLALLNTKREIEFLDPGRLDPSAGRSLPLALLNQLRLYDVVVDSVSPKFLKRHWPQEFEGKAWSTKTLRDMFFSSPQFPRLLNPDILKDTIAKGATNGTLGYVGPKIDGKYEPWYYQKALNVSDVEISDEMFIITPNMAEEYADGLTHTLTSLTIDPPFVSLSSGENISFTVKALDENGEEITRNVCWEATGGHITQDGIFTAGEKDGSDFEVRAGVAGQSAWVKVSVLSKKTDALKEQIELLEQGTALPEEAVTVERPVTQLSWSGELSAQQWLDFHETVLTKIPENVRLKIGVTLDILQESGIPEEQIEEIRAALRELGANDAIK
ncbi:MAG: DUF499 domain-containing protein [bacterium]|nr:DUF499 domain-containing protein [bacterium]